MIIIMPSVNFNMIEFLAGPWNIGSFIACRVDGVTTRYLPHKQKPSDEGEENQRCSPRCMRFATHTRAPWGKKMWHQLLVLAVKDMHLEEEKK